MKNLLFLLALFCALQANAQPYSISFEGSGLSTVKVQNLITGVVVNIPEGDVLLLSTSTGISEVNNMKVAEMKVYPNPMIDESTMEILPPVAGDIIISVCDMTGRVLTQFKGYVENGSQLFRLSNIKHGLYLINVQGNGYQFSEKFLSNGRSDGTPTIARVSSNTHSVAAAKTIVDSKGDQAFVDMAYKNGERLKFTAVSGNNRTVMTDIPVADKTITFNFIECTDADGNSYPVVEIGSGSKGSQFWMAENLKATHYRNGDPIRTTTPATLDISDKITPKYQWAYDGNESNAAIYGRLYTWYAVDDSRGVCPTGWHVSTDEEWAILTSNLGGESVAGGKLKETGTTFHWNSPNTGATDEIGFTALPGGSRYSSGVFNEIGISGAWWTSTEYRSNSAWGRSVDYYNTDMYRISIYREGGFSVRCLKD